MRIPAGAPGARILSLGEHQPANVVTNHDLSRVMDTSDEWIRTRTGIKERHWVVEGETGADLALRATRSARGRATCWSGCHPPTDAVPAAGSSSSRAPTCSTSRRPTTSTCSTTSGCMRRCSTGSGESRRTS